MTRRLVTTVFATLCFVFVDQGISDAQSGSAVTRLRPIGSASAVDRFQNQSSVPATNVAMRAQQSRSAVVRNETAYWQREGQLPSGSSPIRQVSTGPSSVRQTVWMQSGFDAPPLADSGMSLPGTAPNAGLPQPEPVGQPSQNVQPGQGAAIPNSTPFPDAATAPPRALPAPGNPYAPSPSDLDQIPQPSLETNAFARMDNCRLITPPSTYMAASAFDGGCGQLMPVTYSSPGCGPVTQVPITQAPIIQSPGTLPAEIPSTATIPPVSVLPPTTSQPLALPSSAAPARSLITLGQQNYMVQVGQGLWGQPVAYVPGQGIRNWIRYLFP
ncbi:hypothetical protein Mal15_26180 [Stieleria maiorica]|uniref:Uncharacterized protein n=1 Tax=Stieleria maiorica TaxID=2795974 RepID=A0A5B9MG43_9BACT|nr:hypothetical protein [Stieleria maiorica]QEF98565.1 hypothetical protein Mal15_26180 [Stieleria maiorica]